MIDFDKIGKRIYEERKLIRHISQEKMAEDLNLYQADISNLENNRKGSGITDLTRLDTIATYFKIPLQQLLFGSRAEERMDRYLGKNAKLKKIAKNASIPKAHRELLDNVIGEDFSPSECEIYAWGDYRIYAVPSQYKLDTCFAGESTIPLSKLHAYIFFDNAIVAATTVSVVSTFMIMNPYLLSHVNELISRDVLDATDIYRTFVPFMPLVQYSDDESEKEQYREQWKKRIQALQPISDRLVLLIENLYVREECRRKGMCRMLLDTLDAIYGSTTKWLNMEPSSGEELQSKIACHPVFTQAEVSQISLNASIAERLGFTVDPDSWGRDVEVIDADGTTHIEHRLIRKCAYIIHPDIQPIIENDGKLVELGRSRQFIYQTKESEMEKQGEKKPQETKVLFGENAGATIVEVRNGYRSGTFLFVFAAKTADGKTVYGASKKSPIQYGLENIEPIETFTDLKQALNESEYDLSYVIANENLAPAVQQLSPTSTVDISYEPTEADRASSHGHLVKGLRWGYDGGGFACGPVPGNYVVELTILEPSNRVLYACYMTQLEFGQIRTSRSPLFATELEMMHSEDIEETIKDLEQRSIHFDEFILGEVDDADISDQTLRQIYRFLFAALNAYLQVGDDEEGEAKAFIAPYLDKALEDLSLPSITAYNEEEE